MVGVRLVCFGKDASLAGAGAVVGEAARITRTIRKVRRIRISQSSLVFPWSELEPMKGFVKEVT